MNLLQHSGLVIVPSKIDAANWRKADWFSKEVMHQCVKWCSRMGRTGTESKKGDGWWKYFGAIVIFRHCTIFVVAESFLEERSYTIMSQAVYRIGWTCWPKKHYPMVGLKVCCSWFSTFQLALSDGLGWLFIHPHRASSSAALSQAGFVNDIHFTNVLLVSNSARKLSIAYVLWHKT